MILTIFPAYILIAILVYVVPVLLGIDMDGNNKPDAGMTAVFWIAILPLWIVITVVDHAENWRKRTLERKKNESNSCTVQSQADDSDGQH